MTTIAPSIPKGHRASEWGSWPTCSGGRRACSVATVRTHSLQWDRKLRGSFPTIPWTSLMGLSSPVGRVYDLDVQVLLLGIGHDANTTIHLAEALASVRYRRQKSLTIIEGGRPSRYHYGEIDHCCERFNLVDQWLDDGGRQRRGPVGYGEGRLARSRDI